MPEGCEQSRPHIGPAGRRVESSGGSRGRSREGRRAARLEKLKAFWGEKLHEMKSLGIEY
jgi:hypothetical protein